MSDNQNDTEDDAVLTKPKKIRTEAQKAATEKMRSSLAAKQMASGLTPAEKKLRLLAIKEQLNGPLKKNMEKVPEISETDSEGDDQEEEPPPPPPVQTKSIKKESKIVSKAPLVKAPEKKKKEPKVIYESPSESEEEVIIVKKKKKKPKKTIIYESESESEEEPVKAKSRDTKTQQNSSSKFKVTIPDYNEVKKPKAPIYYFE